jgi:hypothetical protein
MNVTKVRCMDVQKCHSENHLIIINKGKGREHENKSNRGVNVIKAHYIHA